MSSQLSPTGLVWKNLSGRRLRTLEHAWMQVYTSSGTDFAVIPRTILNTSLDGLARKKLKVLPNWSKLYR
jgi:hypothetical protein